MRAVSRAPLNMLLDINAVLPRIYADENEKSWDDYMLHLATSVADLEKYADTIRPGARVLLNVQDEFEVEANLYFDDRMRRWMARPDFATRRDLI